LKIKVLLALYQFYSFQLILFFLFDFSTKLAQIMTQEFAKTPILRQPGKILPPLFPQKKPKKACILLHFCIIILFKEKTIFYHPSSRHYNSRTEQTYYHWIKWNKRILY